MRLRGEGLHWRRVEDEIVILDGSRYLSVNASGVELWPLLAEGAERDQLIRRLVDVFDIDSGQATTDVDAFIEDLRSQGLLA